MSVFLAVLGVILGLPGALASLHLTVLSIASIFYEQAEVSASTKRLRFLIVVPAHNESLVIGTMLDSLKRQTRPDDLILVVADHCTDDTAAIATAVNVEVLERTGAGRRGRAMSVTDGINQMKNREWDAVVTLDADTFLEDGFFESLEAAFDDEPRALQPRSEHVRDSGLLARLSEVAFAMQGVTLPRGRSRLGLSVRLRGSGMALSREIALAHSFGTEGVSEDLFYSLGLLLDGYRVGHVDKARLRSLSAPTLSEGGQQRMRWETGRLVAARTFAIPLIKKMNPASIESGVYLLTPPIGIAVLLLSLGSGLLWLAGFGTVALMFAFAILMLAIDVVIALVQSHASWRSWAALLAAPFYILWKAGIQVAAILNVGKAGEPYRPTRRER